MNARQRRKAVRALQRVYDDCGCEADIDWPEARSQLAQDRALRRHDRQWQLMSTRIVECDVCRGHGLVASAPDYGCPYCAGHGLFVRRGCRMPPESWTQWRGIRRQPVSPRIPAHATAGAVTVALDAVVAP